MKIIPFTDSKPIDVGEIRIDLESSLGTIILYVSEFGTRAGLRIEMEGNGKQLSINPLSYKSIEVVVTEAGKEVQK